MQVVKMKCCSSLLGATLCIQPEGEGMVVGIYAHVVSEAGSWVRWGGGE